MGPEFDKSIWADGIHKPERKGSMFQPSRFDDVLRRPESGRAYPRESILLKRFGYNPLRNGVDMAIHLVPSTSTGQLPPHRRLDAYIAY
ncbi:hypothetical protein EV666_10315 [Camelimonas lactis]|uniref:Uncharacterized protein n=1 Tax=Camelimonas lactis TaxID=659006 RepID=A0A4R2GUP0_9HYPH|nr:hypothetical protein EV666_10315 [Camelimonas lactis]